jgi:hypothetical protein
MVSGISSPALARLTDGDSMLERAARIARECAERGEIGLLTPDGYPPCGRIIVPAAVLADLVLVAAVALMEQP